MRLRPIAGGELAASVGVQSGQCAIEVQPRHLTKTVLKPAREDQLDQARRRRAVVPQGVRDTSRLEDVRPGRGNELVVPDHYADLALEHVRQLVFFGVRVWDDQRAEGDRVLDDRQLTRRERPRDLEDDAHPAWKCDLVAGPGKHQLAIRY